MGFFIKRINGSAAENFFFKAYSIILSDKEIESHEKKLDELKRLFPILKDVNKDKFDENLTAVNLELLEIAWTKYCMKKGVGMSQIIDFIVNQKTKIEAMVPELKSYESLETIYNQAFGSSYADGNTAMAVIFISQILEDANRLGEEKPDEMAELINSISYLFVGTFKVSMDFIEQNKLVS